MNTKSFNLYRVVEKEFNLPISNFANSSSPVFKIIDSETLAGTPNFATNATMPMVLNAETITYDPTGLSVINHAVPTTRGNNFTMGDFVQSTNYTCVDQSYRYLLVFIYTYHDTIYNHSDVLDGSVKFDNIAMTRIYSRELLDQQHYRRLTVYGLIAPHAGTKIFRFTTDPPSAVHSHCNIVDYYNVAQTTAIRGYDESYNIDVLGGGGGVTTDTVNPTTVSGDLVVDGIFMTSGSGSVTAETGQTFSDVGGSLPLRTSDRPASTTHTLMKWNWTNVSSDIHVGFSLIPIPLA